MRKVSPVSIFKTPFYGVFFGLPSFFGKNSFSPDSEKLSCANLSASVLLCKSAEGQTPASKPLVNDKCLLRNSLFRLSLILSLGYYAPYGKNHP